MPTLTTMNCRWRLCATPAQIRVRARAAHWNARIDAAVNELYVRRAVAQRRLAAPARQLSRLVYARLGVAAGLAHRLPVHEVVGEAQDYTWKTLMAGFRPGMGQFIPDRFFWARQQDEADAK